jgi:hypothetical protein
MPIFINAQAIAWKNPNILFVSSSSSIYQITFVDEAFSTERVEVTKFISR